jgi:phosphate-selective porin
MAQPWFTTVVCAIALGLIIQANSARAGIEDILYEKGQITKEEWIKAKADAEKTKAEEEKKLDDKFPITVSYGKNGLEFKSRDGNYAMQLGVRLQLRYSYPEDGDSIPADPEASTFRVRRARLKIGGHGYRPWLKYYFEYDWPSNSLLDWRGDIALFKGATLRVGQWKVEYNRERVDSSGAQQFVDRSIVNSPFTLDRQIGARLGGHLFPDTPGYLIYNAGVFTGVGLNQPSNDDTNMLYVGRLQWNFFGRDLPFSQSDVEYHENPTGSLAVAGANNRSNRKTFPSSSPQGANGEFKINQAVQEFAFKWRGFSVQQELHIKSVDDQVNGKRTTSYGAYVQTGYFPHALISFIPQPLEFAYRYAFVDPDDTVRSDVKREHTVAANWFFAGHRNKITVDYSHLSQEGGFTPVDRVRLQWDVSF